MVKLPAPQFDFIDPLGLVVITERSADKRYNRNLINHIVQRSTEQINDLEPDTKAKCIKMFRTAFSEGLLMLVYSSYRTMYEQQVLYKKWKDGTGYKASVPGLSYHNYAMAFDCMVVQIDAQGALPIGYKALQLINIKLKLGLVWGGTFVTTIDPPHFQNELESIEALRNNSAEYKEWFDNQDKLTQEEMLQVSEISDRFEKVRKDNYASWYKRNVGWIFPTSLLLAGTLLVLAIMRFRKE